MLNPDDVGTILRDSSISNYLGKGLQTSYERGLAHKNGKVTSLEQSLQTFKFLDYGLISGNDPTFEAKQNTPAL